MVDFLNAFSRKAVLIGDVPVDVLVEEGVPLESEVTEHPVEDGYNVTDHRRIRPRYLNLTCIFVDWDPGGLANTVSSIRNGTFSDATWRKKRDRLIEYFNSGKLLSVTLPEESLKNMQIVAIRPDRRSATSNAYFFGIELRELRKVSTSSRYVDPDSIPKEVVDGKTEEQESADRIKQEKQNKGTKTAKSSNSSTLKKLVDGLSSAFGA